jgi:hypothetical protein
MILRLRFFARLASILLSLYRLQFGDKGGYVKLNNHHLKAGGLDHGPSALRMG